jgi:hypothetical protein
VFWVTVQLFAQGSKIGNGGFLLTDTVDFRRLENDFRLLCEIGIVFVECVADSLQEIEISFFVVFLEFLLVLLIFCFFGGLLLGLFLWFLLNEIDDADFLELFLHGGFGVDFKLVVKINIGL